MIRGTNSFHEPLHSLGRNLSSAPVDDHADRSSLVSAARLASRAVRSQLFEAGSTAPAGRCSVCSPVPPLNVCSLCVHGSILTSGSSGGSPVGGRGPWLQADPVTCRAGGLLICSPLRRARGGLQSRAASLWLYHSDLVDTATGRHRSRYGRVDDLPARVVRLREALGWAAARLDAADRARHDELAATRNAAIG
jgi:hypothetical protein